MQVRYMTVLINWINIAIMIAIAAGIIKVIKEVKKYMNRTKEIDKKLDVILDELEKRRDD